MHDVVSLEKDGGLINLHVLAMDMIRSYKSTYKIIDRSIQFPQIASDDIAMAVAND